MTLATWHETTLEDVCSKITDGAHQSPKSVDVGKPMASVKDMTQFGITLASCRLISESDFEKLVKQGCKPMVDDVLIAKDGNSALDTVCRVRKPLDAVLLSSIAILRPDKNKVDPDFLRLYLDAEPTRNYLKSSAISGAAIPRVILQDFKRAKIRLPEIEEQRKIANTISTYDNLIENNNRRIAILEEMAQSLYREWFVKFRFPGHEYTKFSDSPLGKIPEGWVVEELGNFIDFWNGKKTEKTDDGEYVLYGANGVIGKTQEFRYENAIIIGRVGAYCGAVEYCFDKFWGSDNTIIAKLKNSQYISYLYLLLKSLNLNSFAGGAAQPLLTQTTLKKIRVVKPSNHFIEKWFNFAKAFYGQIDILKKKNDVLKCQRDMLLPKIISGNIFIKDSYAVN